MFGTKRLEMVKTFIRLADAPDYFQPDPFFVDWNTNWTSLLCMIQAKCARPANELNIYYWDEEDYVRISSQEELEEALRLAGEIGCLQLFVESNTTPVKHHAAEEGGCPLYVGQKRNPLIPRLKCEYSPSSNSSMCARVGSLEHIEGGSDETFPQRWSSTQSLSENSQPSELPKAENQKNGSGTAPMQGNEMDAVSGVALDPQDAKLAQRVALENQTEPVDSNDHYAALQMECAIDKMLADYSEGHLSDDEDEDGIQEHMMMPGALSGANVIAIEMPEIEHHGTETAEPAEIAETGEMSTKSGRDAETGFWVQLRNEARLSSKEMMAKEEASLRRIFHDYDLLRRSYSQLGERLRGKKNTSLRTPEDRAYLQERLMKLHECKKTVSKLKDGAKSSKKHCGREDLSTEDSTSDSVRNADCPKIKRAARNSSTTLDSSSPLETVTEVSSDTSSLVKKQEHRPSKSEGKKKKHLAEPLTSKAFFDYMSKFEVTVKKDLVKTVAKKTARAVIKSLPKQAEGSEAPSNPPAVPRSSGYVHEDIFCDCCDRDIVGTRYICGNCADYDLCEECESIQPSVHDSSHVFIKLRRPCWKAGTRRGVRVPLLKKLLYNHKEGERKVDPERIQVIMEHTKGQESHVERHTSRNNNNEREAENDQQGLFEQELERREELAQLEERLKRVQEKTVRAADCLSSIPALSSAAKAEDAEVGEGCEDLDGPQIAGYEMNVHHGGLDPGQGFRPLESPKPDLLATPAGDVFDRVPWDGGITKKLPMPYESSYEDFACFRDMPLVKPEKEVPTTMLSGCVFWDEEDSVTPELKTVQDDFVMFQRYREAIPEFEVIPAIYTELADATISPQTEVKLSSDDRTDCQQQETDDVSPFSSLAEDSSSDEEFVVILPDCFDVSKPLHLESAVDSPDSDGINLEEDLHSNVPALGSHKEPEVPIQPAGILDGPENEADENDQHTPSADIPSLLPSVPESNTVEESKEEEDDFKEEEHVSLQEDSPAPREVDIQQIEDAAAASEEQLPETQSQSSQSTTEEPEDSSLNAENAEETVVKEIPQPEEEGAAAAEDSMDMMTKTFKVAKGGLQRLFQTGKDIFETLQSGDSYECKESTYEFKPSDYTLPESTWKPSRKEYLPPKSTFTLRKSEFQMPKSSYVAPQYVVMPGASIYTGEYAGAVHRIREMGYFNNERTMALLRKYDGDIPKVVNELVEETDGDWAQRRHGDRS